MIRIANKLDIKSINFLGKKYNNNFEKLFNIEKIIFDENYKVYIYEKNKAIIGFLIVLNTYEISNIILIFVDENFRNNHIATNLIDYYISELPIVVEKITLEVNVTNVNAIKLYKNFGFETIHVRKQYYSDNNDAYIMERKIKDE